ncbi:MAG: YVTN family beta-propeller repeat-containing protein [Treponemataceae bacterium]|nr:YVTN family beta-propeller repeat-containing protein [Treponemataceae bacterium]
MKRLLICLVILSACFFVFAQKAETVPVFEKIGVYSCGKQPKQVIFSPDSKFVVLPLLEDEGFDIFSVEQKKVIKRIAPPEQKKQGFAEGLFIAEKKSFFVSQMTTGNIYEYSYPEFELKRTISTKGTWSKFIAYNSKYDVLVVSNWVSNDVSVIDYATGSVKKLIKTKAAPRGMTFVDDSENLIVLAFDGGTIQKFSMKTYEQLDSIYIEKAAMRHIVKNKDETKAWVSDMYHANVLELNLKEFKIENKYHVFNNPNTIDLLDDRYLCVSCRGPNNKQDYTKRSPQNGKIIVIDTDAKTQLCEIPGGNQPTGLALSGDQKLLVFSDFQDEALELYKITTETVSN